MSASNIRERIAETGGHYLCPLPRIGTIPEEMDKWTEEGAEAA